MELSRAGITNFVDGRVLPAGSEVKNGGLTDGSINRLNEGLTRGGQIKYEVMNYFPSPIFSTKDPKGLSDGKKFLNAVFLGICIFCPPFLGGYALGALCHNMKIESGAMAGLKLAQKKEQFQTNLEIKVNNFKTKLKDYDALIDDKPSFVVGKFAHDPRLGPAHKELIQIQKEIKTLNRDINKINEQLNWKGTDNYTTPDFGKDLEIALNTQVKDYR